MSDPLADLATGAMRDAVIHRAYLHALKTPCEAPDGTPLPPASDEDARAMVSAYIQAQGVAKMRLELPPEPGERW